MLQGILPAQFRVGQRVGESQPRAARRKCPKPLAGTFLILIVRLKEMMKAQHEAVVNGALIRSRLKDAEKALTNTPGPALGKHLRQARKAAVLAEQSLERV